MLSNQEPSTASHAMAASAPEWDGRLRENMLHTQLVNLGLNPDQEIIGFVCNRSCGSLKTPYPTIKGLNVHIAMKHKDTSLHTPRFALVSGPGQVARANSMGGSGFISQGGAAVSPVRSGVITILVDARGRVLQAGPNAGEAAVVVENDEHQHTSPSRGTGTLGVTEHNQVDSMDAEEHAEAHTPPCRGSTPPPARWMFTPSSGPVTSLSEFTSHVY